MIDLTHEMTLESPIELEAAIAARLKQRDGLVVRRTEILELIKLATDPERRKQLKREGHLLTETLGELDPAIDRLKAARRQAIENARLVELGGGVMTPVWPEMPGERRNRRVRTRGVE
jgi:hypothetical protein